MNTENLSASIRHNRELYHLTQEKLAELIGSSTHYVYELEKGLKLPSLKCLISLAETFHTSVDALLSEPSATPQHEHDELSRLLQNLNPKQREQLASILKALLPHLKL